MGAAASVAATSPAPATIPVQHFDLTKLTCAQMLDADVLDRSSVMMFYWGYVAGKAGATAFDTTGMEAKTARVMQTCMNNPKMTLFAAIDASKNGK
ncbi:MAG: hypothetical protein JOY86_07190 [Candidatus Eremiobacteraeota bacterium]|nr:hypothetical protein [Candidatus Eremiobacteraeota bacterium]